MKTIIHDKKRHGLKTTAKTKYANQKNEYNIVLPVGKTTAKIKYANQKKYNIRDNTLHFLCVIEAIEVIQMWLRHLYENIEKKKLKVC